MRKTQDGRRLRIAVIANEQTPYRLNLHRRIAREMPEIDLWSLFTHEVASSPWHYLDDPQIRCVLFGRGQAIREPDTARAFFREWTKGGRITRWLEEHDIGAIVLYGYNDVARLRIVRWAAHKRVPCFLFGDSNLCLERATGIKALLKRIYVPWILRQTSAVFHCGKLGRDYFLRYGVAESRLYPFPYEPDYQLFSKPLTPDSSRRFGLTAGRRRLIFVGRMVTAKRPDLILTAFERVARERPEWELVMVGDGHLRPELQSRYRSRVHWLGFIPDATELATLYAACDVFVLPSDFEPWGVVLTEAAAAGLALVASSIVGSAADLIQEGVNGMVFPHGDLRSLSDAVFKVTDPQNVDRMKAASATVLARWRKGSDPVRNLRRALQDAGALSHDLVYAG
jgi:glycosyltransferase involved in cell wall biosynthesis